MHASSTRKIKPVDADPLPLDFTFGVLEWYIEEASSPKKFSRTFCPSFVISIIERVFLFQLCMKKRADCLSYFYVHSSSKAHCFKKKKNAESIFSKIKREEMCVYIYI